MINARIDGSFGAAKRVDGSGGGGDGGDNGGVL